MGNTTRVKVVKNKVAPPFKEVEFDIMYGEGISKMGELVDLGVKAGVVEKSGSWYSYGDERIGQGRENAKPFLQPEPRRRGRDRGQDPRGATGSISRPVDGEDVVDDVGLICRKMPTGRGREAAGLSLAPALPMHCGQAAPRGLNGTPDCSPHRPRGPRHTCRP